MNGNDLSLSNTGFDTKTSTQVGFYSAILMAAITLVTFGPAITCVKNLVLGYNLSIRKANI
jgi:hypothetical protein